MREDNVSAISLLRDLIRCDSVTPKEAGALDQVETFLAACGFSVSRQVFSGDGSYPVDNLFATYGSGGKHILFGGHTDVVPPGDLSLWTHGPFSAEIADDEIWGRGAVDMKSGVAAFCAAAASTVQRLPENGAGRISLAITNDEEADAINGTVKLMQWAQKEGHAFDFAIVGEPSSKSEFGDSIKIGRRGSFSARVTIKGKQGHSAYPERANNPVPVAAAIAAEFSDFVFDQGSDHFQPTNLEVTSIDVGNSASNVIPSEASILFNIRFNDHWTAETLTAKINALIGRVDAMGCTVSWALIGAVAKNFVSPLSDDVTNLVETIAAHTGKTPDLATFGGTSDARFIADYCPVVECGLVGTTMHQIDERVPVDDVNRLTALYADFLWRFFAMN